MSKLTKSSKGKSCTVRIPFVCNFNDETTVSAHLNGIRFGHGVGKKTNDLFSADCCSACHDLLDGQVKNTYGYSEAELKLMHLEGVIETQARRLQEGLITIE